MLFTYTIGPRYGRGMIFEVVGQGAHGRMIPCTGSAWFLKDSTGSLRSLRFALALHSRHDQAAVPKDGTFGECLMQFHDVLGYALRLSDVENAKARQEIQGSDPAK